VKGGQGSQVRLHEVDRVRNWIVDLTKDEGRSLKLLYERPQMGGGEEGVGEGERRWMGRSGD